MNLIKKIFRYTLKKIGLEIKKIDSSFFLADENFEEIYNFCKPFTMTSIDRMYALYKATEYIAHNQIPGDIVECGVWKGGSAMLIAMTLIKMGSTDRKIFLYDTYEGMAEPSDLDIDIKGKSAKSFFVKSKKDNFSTWCYSPIDEVKKNLLSTAYPSEKMIFVKGMVEKTIPDNMPSQISLLRLDTDWYDSTYHEMKYLFPILSTNGVLILDDYGHWQGAKKAVDKYFNESGRTILLNKIDYSGRVGVKI